MNTLAKHTFDTGASLELYQRKDGTHRIKFTGESGDELVLNLHQKEWAKGRPMMEYMDIIQRAERAYNEDINGPKSTGDGAVVGYIGWMVLALCGYDFRNSARLYSKATDEMEECVSSIQDIIDGNGQQVPPTSNADKEKSDPNE